MDNRKTSKYVIIFIALIFIISGILYLFTQDIYILFAMASTALVYSGAIGLGAIFGKGGDGFAVVTGVFVVMLALIFFLININGAH